MRSAVPPIAFIIFNRPEHAQKVFNEIRNARPEKLFIIADGPRTPAESALCEETRAVVTRIDWPCEVRRNYADVNLGVKQRISSGITWFFEHVSEGIILEDDCLPDQSFFPYCKELLERYKDDTRIMHISGDNFQQNNSKFACKESYYFSRIPHVWGWATWRRAWNLYDAEMKRWPEVKKLRTLGPVFKNYGVYEYLSYSWDVHYENKKDNWDRQWVFACALYGGACINPAVNLVSNIGFGNNSTHTKEMRWFADMPRHAMSFPLAHPKNISIDRSADAYTFRELFDIDRKIYHRILRPIKKMFPGFHASAKKLFGKK